MSVSSPFRRRLMAATLFCALLCAHTPPAHAQELRESLREKARQKIEERVQALRNPLNDHYKTNGDTGFMRTSPSTNYETLTSGGLPRQYLLYVPPGADENLPLVIALHGTYGSGAKMEKHLGFDYYARKEGFLVAYPDAYRKEGSSETARWNDGRGVLESSRLGVDDVAFIADLIDDIAAKYHIDRTRVFVTGSSNGGIMAYRAGCELKGKIRAIAPEIGNVAQPLAYSCKPQAGVSVLSINGAADPIIPLSGGTVCKNVRAAFCEGGNVVSRAQSISYFAQANDCDTQPHSNRRTPRTDDKTEVEDIVYGGCAGGAQVRSIVVHGMGHVWPPLSGQTGKSGPTSKNLNATQEIVSFFMGLK